MSRRLTLSAFVLLFTAQCNGYQGSEEVVPALPPECTSVLAEAEVSTDDSNMTVLSARGCSALQGALLKFVPSTIRVPGNKIGKVRVQLRGSNEQVAQNGERALTPSVSITLSPSDAELTEALLILPYRTPSFDAQFLLQEKERPALYGARAAAGSPTPSTAEFHGAYVLHDEKNALIGARIGAALTYQGLVDGETVKVPTNKLDALFVLDNSGSMTSKQMWLADSIEDAFKDVSGHQRFGVPKQCVDYRLGIITTDMGNSEAMSGDNGALQTKYCTERGLVGTALDACKAACPTVPATPIDPVKKYLESPAGSTDVAKQMAQFKCAAIVGNQGSGIEQPLKSTDKFIHDEDALRMAGKEGFFRTDALSALIALTDEEDCSIEPGKGAGVYANPNVECIRRAMKCTTGTTGCVYSDDPTSGLGSVKGYVDYMAYFFTELKKTFDPDPSLRRRTVVMRSLFPMRDDTVVAIPPLSTTVPYKIDHKYEKGYREDADSFCQDTYTDSKGAMQKLFGHPGVRMYEWAREFYKSFSGGMVTTTRPQVGIENLCKPKGRAAWLGSDGMRKSFAVTMFEIMAPCAVTLR